MTKMLNVPETSSPAWDTFKVFARVQVQGFIQQFLEEEVAGLLDRQKSELRPALDARPGSRNGHRKPRKLALIGGRITVQRPRVGDVDERVVSRLPPLFRRRPKEVAALVPELYLHGMALADIELPRRRVLGDAAPLSASSLVRFKATWQGEYAAWQKRESTERWATGLRSLEARGLRAPKLMVTDGHLGTWSAFATFYPESAEQRCWNHLLRSVADSAPTRRQVELKAALQ